MGVVSGCGWGMGCLALWWQSCFSPNGLRFHLILVIHDDNFSWAGRCGLVNGALSSGTIVFQFLESGGGVTTRSTSSTQVVSHPSTILAQCCLTFKISWKLLCPPGHCFSARCWHFFPKNLVFFANISGALQGGGSEHSLRRFRDGGPPPCKFSA